MTAPTTVYGEDAARDRLRGDWDADGTVSVHLPRDVAERLLAERGWRYQRNASWEGPTGRTYWHIEEALAVALIAENE